MCRMLLIGFIALVIAAPGFAQDAKPNTLTPKEIADGWILLFDGETTFGWSLDDKPKIVGGEWSLSSRESIETTTHLGDGVLKFEYRGILGLSLLGEELPLPATLGGGTWTDGWYMIKHGKVTRALSLKSETTFAEPMAQSVFQPTPIVFKAALGKLALRNVKFRPAITDRLFNGKDLAGWKIFPGKKSEFTVSDGAIHMKNGPGDLQTEKKFGDFCLQLQCISHGPHLNSGVFFRCRPDEYQNGYEAQIRNQFTEKPTQKYVLEDYGPMTHKLLGKKEAFFTAVDYGTGAIYRRQPARKEVAKDKEWFTMTIVAHGNHLATWVNGIQVTDWHDNRPPGGNARTGCRLEAGHISLQGHDPTTDLSFRNFRIQEYPK